ncbi:MAG: cell division ATP-binding protein FtsE [Candidatus Coatesbacteria bacterium]|nr:MAG: cell division ATP-binding protein FtsE [Candidatus Coatesbacteria bacterium]
MIRFDEVTKVYDDRIAALDDVNVHVKKGEFAFLTGPSGAGKTTFLKMIYAAERPTSGTVTVAGHDIGRMRRRQVPYLRRRIGVVFQDFRLLGDRPVLENVMLPMTILGLSPAERRRRALQVLSVVGLGQRKDDRPDELSGGEQQRVAIARAIALDPVVLLADEPTGNLDPTLTEHIMKLFRAINARGTSVIVATHDYEVVRRTEARVIKIIRGRVEAGEAAR